MRLWHQDLIPFLPRQQLLGQHRECCALRGAGWGRSHATVNYVFAHSPLLLFAYHRLILEEMVMRGYSPDSQWFNKNYRGKKMKSYADQEELAFSNPIYPEHDEDYLKECLSNLESKGIEIRFFEGLFL